MFQGCSDGKSKGDTYFAFSGVAANVGREDVMWRSDPGGGTYLVRRLAEKGVGFLNNFLHCGAFI
jgi:hypothetical protein